MGHRDGATGWPLCASSGLGRRGEFFFCLSPCPAQAGPYNERRDYGGITRDRNLRVSTAGVELHEFQENVEASLREGSFLLLIVRDRISPNIALLTNAIQSAPGLAFTLGAMTSIQWGGITEAF
jgi:hypothetical protein